MKKQPLRPPYTDEQIRSLCRQIVRRAGTPNWIQVVAIAQRLLELERVADRRNSLRVIAGGRL